MSLSVGCEIEWYLGREEADGTLVAAHYGPAYSAIVLAQLSDYVSVASGPDGVWVLLSMTVS